MHFDNIRHEIIEPRIQECRRLINLCHKKHSEENKTLWATIKKEWFLIVGMMSFVFCLSLGYEAGDYTMAVIVGIAISFFIGLIYMSPNVHLRPSEVKKINDELEKKRKIFQTKTDSGIYCVCSNCCQLSLAPDITKIIEFACPHCNAKINY